MLAAQHSSDHEEAFLGNVTVTWFAPDKRIEVVGATLLHIPHRLSESPSAAGP